MIFAPRIKMYQERKKSGKKIIHSECYSTYSWEGVLSTVAVDTVESVRSWIKRVHKDTMPPYVGVIIDQDEGILKNRIW